MDESITFKTKEELYNRVLPALYSKVKETRKFGFKHITEKDIWNYLVENEWKKRVNLELSDIISDILYVDNNKLNDAVMQKVKELREKEKIKDI